MAKLTLLMLLMLVVAQDQEASAEYSNGDQSYQEDGGPELELPGVRGSQVVLSEAGRGGGGGDEYVVGYSPDSLVDLRESDINRLMRLYRMAGFRAPHIKRLFSTGNRQSLIETDSPYAKVFAFNKWGDSGLDGLENHLSSKKADQRPTAGGALEKLLETNFRLNTRKKKSRCVADDSRGIKNPSFCDMDAYFGAAGYRSDLWDSAGRR